MPQVQRPGPAALSHGAGTTILSYGLRGERQHPYLRKALLGVCLVKPHPRLRDKSSYLFELFVGTPEILPTTLLQYECVVLLLQRNERFQCRIFTARSEISLRFLWAHLRRL